LYGWAAAVALIIFAESSRGHLAVPTVAGIDKVAHFAVFGLLGTALARIPKIAGMRPFGVFAAVILASLYGAADEWHQSFVPGRSVDFADWLADSSGALVAVLIYDRWTLYRRVLERTIGSRPRVGAGAAAG
jgi:VanZ family protein